MDEEQQPPRRRKIAQAGTGPSCLYPEEAEIARLILPKSRVPHWRGLAVVLERSGFPRIDPEFGGRYWPAVKAFLDRRNHVIDDSSQRRGRY